MRTLNMVRELITRLVGLTAPPQRKLRSSAGNASAGSDVVYIVMLAQLARGARPVQHLSLSSYGYFPNSRARHSLVV